MFQCILFPRSLSGPVVDINVLMKKCATSTQIPLDRGTNVSMKVLAPTRTPARA